MLAPKTPQNPQRSQRCLQDPLANKAARPVGGGGQSLQMEQLKSLKNKLLKNVVESLKCTYCWRVRWPRAKPKMAKRISFCTTILLHDSNDNVVSCGSPVSDCRVELKMDDLVTVAEAGSIIYCCCSEWPRFLEGREASRHLLIWHQEVNIDMGSLRKIQPDP